MQVRSKEIYEQLAKKTNLPMELIESVGNCVFEKLRYKLDHPDQLAYELPKFGHFPIRFKIFERYYINFQKLLDKEDPEAVRKRDNNPELYKRTTAIYNKIQEFRAKKKEVKTERHAKGEDNSNEHKEVHNGLDKMDII